ncbi:hypothetical protein SAMN05216474_2067 [Lishizhenia tianjinensis]|uniref:Outer membrane protein beta-barrel domain-containing protein n=1 Tax=Lishizhenia tianjinensis TaxID=477690 RepID=A0A1I7AGE9_9FLAO|nr:hypothetical protein [Lishizhenia tianjinensis]SFT74019.1 hypothetical protein SAMN05216474_2067 [Lishizhenia tianjinensis]
MKNFISLLLSLCFLPLQGNTQIPEKQAIAQEYYSNALYGSLGYGGKYATANSYFEHCLTANDKIKTLGKIGYGGYYTVHGTGSYLLGHVGLLTGAKNHHLEASIGANFFFGDALIEEIPLGANLGYRFQKPQGIFLLRTGISYPEGVYVGIGTCF